MVLSPGGMGTEIMCIFKAVIQFVPPTKLHVELFCIFYSEFYVYV